MAESAPLKIKQILASKRSLICSGLAALATSNSLDSHYLPAEYEQCLPEYIYRLPAKYEDRLTIPPAGEVRRPPDGIYIYHLQAEYEQRLTEYIYRLTAEYEQCLPEYIYRLPAKYKDRLTEYIYRKVAIKSRG